MVRRTLINGTAIFGGEAFTRLATFLMALIVARWFGPVALGQYGYALAFASVLLLVPDLGLNLLATRELAAEPRELRRIFWSLHWLKIPLVIGVAIFTVFFGAWFIGDSGRRFLLYILVARALLQAFSMAYMAIFKAFERMHYIALQQFVNAVLTISCASIVLWVRGSLFWVVAAFLVGQAAETWLGWRIVRRRFETGALYGWDWKFLRPFFLAALPIGITGILQALNLRLDIIVLGFFVPNAALGQFQAAQWFLVGSFLFAALVMSVLFPKLSRLLATPSREAEAYLESLLKYSVLLTALGSLAVWLVAPYVLQMVFGKALSPASGLLRILAPVLPFMFLNTVLFYVFIAARRRTIYLGTLATGALITVTLGPLLASQFGSVGSAATDLVQEFVMAVIFFYFLKREGLAPSAGLALLRVSFMAACLAVVVGMFGGFVGPRVGWSVVWNCVMLAGTLFLIGSPRLQDLILLAGEGS